MARERAESSKPVQDRIIHRGRIPHEKQENPDAPKTPQPSANSVQSKGALANANAITTDSPLGFDAQTLGTDFLAATYGNSGYIPPNAVGAVGPSQILVVVNGRIRTFNKSGVLDSALDTTTDLFFGSVRNGRATTDSRVLFDPLSQRWFVSMINMPVAPNRVMLAVSNGPTISSLNSFTFFQFQQDLVGETPNLDTGYFADFPTLGVDKNGVYIGTNIFVDVSNSNTYMGVTAFVLNKTDLLSGTLTVTVFRHHLGGSTLGMFGAIAATNPDPNATQAYFVGAVVNSLTGLHFRDVNFNSSNGTFSLSPANNNLFLSISAADPISVPAQGSTLPLDGLDRRLMNAQVSNGSLWTTHGIQVDATGAASSTGGRNGMRFYEITNLSGTPSIRQSGTLFDSAATNPLSYWGGTIATSGQGHTVIASTYAGPTAYAGAAFAGRLSGDPLGTLSAPTVLVTGGGAYNLQTSTPTGTQRWGDVSNVVVDPSDNMTMWSFQEYTNATNSWGVRVNQLKAPPPATPTSAFPSSTPSGTTLNVTITGTSTSGSGFYDPGAGFPNRLSATVNGGGVTVNSVTYTNPTTITLNITINVAPILGSRTITVTNPDGQSMTSSTGILTINPALITLSPVTLPNGTAGVSYGQTVAASGGAGPYTFSILTGGALPTGLVLNGPTVTGTPTTSGTASFTVKAVDSLGNIGTRLYTMSIQSLLSGNISLGISSRSYDSTPSPIYPGGRWTLNTTLTNTGSSISSSLFFKITGLAKAGADQDPTHPNMLISADNGAGVVGDTQTLGISSLLNGQSTPVSFLVGIGSRQTFTITVDLYTVLSGSAMTASDAGSFKMAAVADTMATAADTAPSGPAILLGHYQFEIKEAARPSPSADSDLNTDPLSNVGVITGPGPQSGPAVAVDPIIPSHIAVASNDYLGRAIRVNTSQDGGKNWHAATLSNSVGPQSFYTAQNPSLAFDSLGRLSVVYTLSNLGDSTNAVVISESSDGINFNPPSALSFHLASERVIDSRPVIAIKAGAGRYVAWDSLSNATHRYSINLVRSEEGGPFGPVTAIVSDGLVSSPSLALSKNSVYVGWDEWGFNSSSPYNTGGRLMIATSPNRSKIKFDPPQEIARTSIGFAQKIIAMPEKGVSPNLSIAVDPKKEDRVYAVFTDKANGTRIRFAWSGNRGKTWQVASVSDDPNGSDQFSPSIALDSDGNVKISYYDTRLSSTFETAHVFLASSSTGASFATERITTISSNDSKSNPLRDYTTNLGDRTSIAMTDEDVLMAWTDTRLESEDIFASIVADSDGESIAGSGKIMSPAGAFPAYPALTGKAEFGFVTKYKKHASTLTGDTEFNFHLDKFKFRFKSKSYDWLEVKGANGQLKGSGKINGTGDYGFLLTVVDGGRRGAGLDKFRIKIVDKTTGAVVYDNIPGAPEDIDNAALQPIIEGRIQIYNK